MKIQKIKEWVKYKNGQFIPTGKLIGEIVRCKRIKDDKEFSIGPLQIDALFIKDTRYYIRVTLSRIHNDLINVSLSGYLTSRYGVIKDTTMSQVVQIDDVEEWINTISQYVKIKASFLQEIIEV